MKKYAIFQENANGQGGYDTVRMIDKYKPSTNKQEMEDICSMMNKWKPDSWHYFTIYEVNDNNEPMCHGDVIKINCKY